MKLAIKIQNALQESCNRVFMEEDKQIGPAWAARTKSILDIVNFVIVILSENAAQSPVVEEQLRMVGDLQVEGISTAQLLPVGVNCSAVSNSEINGLLEDLPWVLYMPDRDEYSYDRLAAHLKSAIVNSAPLPDGKAERTAVAGLVEMRHGRQNKAYLQREGDEIVDRIIEAGGTTLTIKGSRQIGKTWLVNRVMSRLTRRQLAPVRLDMQKFGGCLQAETGIEALGRQLCYAIADELRLELDTVIDDIWQRPMTAALRVERFIEHLLSQTREPLFLFLDNTDVMLKGSEDQRTDFFSMLRSWHENRGSKRHWEQLSLVVVISTEPWLLIKNLDQSPFNVGTTITLRDFTPAQAQSLNSHYNEAFTATQLQQLYDLVSGHPYLTHRAIRQAEHDKALGTRTLKNPTDEDSLFADHLRSLFLRLQRGGDDLIAGMRHIIEKRQCDDLAVYQRLRSAGLVREERRKKLPRCRLYEMYFQAYLD